MKKLFLLIVSASALLSCSNDDNGNTSKVLQKVVFYRDSPNARQWNFSNDLLTTITLPNGTIVEQFTYDNLNRVVRDVKYNDGTIIEINDIAYNADNTIKSINGLEYAYNAATRTYSYTYSGSFSLVCRVNSDLLAVDYSRTDTVTKDYHLTYVDGNMTSFEKSTNGTTEVLKNFHFDGDYFGNNPIYNAVLAVARVKSLTDPNFFIDNQTSKDIPNGFDKGTTDPYYYNYGSVPDSAVYQVGIEVLDSNNAFVEFYAFADYYYQ